MIDLFQMVGNLCTTGNSNFNEATMIKTSLLIFLSHCVDANFVECVVNEELLWV